MAWLFDSRAWNLAGPVAAVVLAGCGPRIIVDQGETDTIGDPDPNNPNAQSCTSDVQCPEGYCSAQGVCVSDPTGDPYYPDPYDPYCDGYGCCYDDYCCYYDCCYDGCCYGDCYYEDYCDSDYQCDGAEACNDYYCGPVEQALECGLPEPTVTEIPVADVTTSLTFAEADGTAGEELVSRNELILRVHDDLDGTPSTTTQPLANTSTPAEMLAVDLDGDGLEEVISAEHGSGHALRLFAALGGNALSQVQLAPTDLSSHYALADVTGDGVRELVGITPDGYGFLTVSGASLGAASYYAHSPGQPLFAMAAGNFSSSSPGHELFGLEELATVLIDEAGNTPTAIDWDWSGPRALTVGDVNGDGLSDAVTGLRRPADSLIEFWYGDELDISAFPRGISVPIAVEQLWTADVNGDGVDELVLYGEGLLSVLYPDSCLQTVASVPQLFALAAGDSDGDGADELAYSDSTGLYLLDFGGG